MVGRRDTAPAVALDYKDDHNNRIQPPDRDDQPVVHVTELVKTFRRANGSQVRALDGVSIDVMPGEFVVLLGPSGCGKTTLLRSVAGLETPSGGVIEVQGRTVFSAEDRILVPPERRRLSMIFQSYALWPHMTAFANIAYPLACRKLPKDEITERVHHVLELVGIGTLGKQHPSGMSGGQQQRVALARALVSNDQLVLFDEPLSNVDAKVREKLRAELLAMQSELGFAALYVTHDQIEAMEMADRMAVMGEGKVEQVGSPAELYDRPATPYVARFIGMINEIPGELRERTDGIARVSTHHMGDVLVGEVAEDVAVGDEALVVVRPESTKMSVEEPTSQNKWPARVRTALYVGSHTEYIVELDRVELRTWCASRSLIPEGADVWISIDPKDTLVLQRDTPE